MLAIAKTMWGQPPSAVRASKARFFCRSHSQSGTSAEPEYKTSHHRNFLRLTTQKGAELRSGWTAEGGCPHVHLSLFSGFLPAVRASKARLFCRSHSQSGTSAEPEYKRPHHRNFLWLTTQGAELRSDRTAGGGCPRRIEDFCRLSGRAKLAFFAVAISNLYLP